MTIRTINTDRSHIDTNFRTTGLGANNKPVAEDGKDLWYSLNASWVKWCTENHHWGWIKHKHFEVNLDESKILKLSNEGDLVRFTQEFISEKYQKQDSFYIDWHKVAEKWAGIEVSEECVSRFQKDKRFQWLDGWSVGGGCIWDGSAIISAQEIPQPALETLLRSTTGREPAGSGR